MKYKKYQPPAVVTEPTALELGAKFIELCQSAKVHGVKSAAAYILAGAEYTLVCKKLGIQHGGDRKSDQGSTRGTLILAELLKLGNVSKTTVWRMQKSAEEAADRLPILESVLADDVPISMLPEAAKIKLNAAVQVLAAGKSYRQLAWDWGIEKKLKGGDRSLSDKALIKQFCQEYHPDMPWKECQALPGPLKKEFRKWAANQPAPAPDHDALMDVHIEAMDLIIGSGVEPAKGCSMVKLKQAQATAEALNRMFSDLIKERKGA